MTDFRLSYLNGSDFVDLFPKTSMESLIDGDNILSFIVIPVTIPVTIENIQTIPLVTSETNLEDFWVDMYLMGNTEADKIAYATITQYEIKQNELIITRLNKSPVSEIQVQLIFYKQGV